MSTAALEAIGITKRFPHRELLRGIGLSLAAGGRYVLTGDNGCGKTTLLRIIAGFESADSGEMRVDGGVVSLGRYPEALRRKLIYVHQHPYLFNTSINHNIAYGLKARGEPAKGRQVLVEDAIQWAGVGHLTGVLPQKLSGGEKQRVALARAKVLNPHLLLLDEPTASLDSEARSHAIELIDKLCADGVTVLIACHDREIIDMPGMKRLLLESGRVVPM